MAEIALIKDQDFDFTIGAVPIISKIATPHLRSDYAYSFGAHRLPWQLVTPNPGGGALQTLELFEVVVFS